MTTNNLRSLAQQAGLRQEEIDQILAAAVNGELADADLEMIAAGKGRRRDGDGPVRDTAQGVARGTARVARGVARGTAAALTPWPYGGWGW